ncbi:TIGR02757 family protein [Tenacibaculum sp. 190524A02b]|uniref:TIGR02757 family protein n=1 Tax=Tenacibaculum vairaonense TaxID=3137860 RepID=A0ABM9PJ54_9FLAO
MNKQELKDFLNAKVIEYNTLDFIESDPIQIPHLFTQKEDIEIAGFLAATIAWGNRKMIIKNAHRMIDILGNSPYDFVMNYTDDYADRFEGFVHRTFNAIDFNFFVKSLQNIYQNHSGLEKVLKPENGKDNYQQAIHKFKQAFFEIPHQDRTLKHVSDPLKNSASKRINMFLRWMVRKDNTGVDLGIWNSHSPKHLHCPLDVHSGNVARKLGLLTRKQNDWKALIELDSILREFDSNDPVKYDFALFGLGVFEKF